MLDASSSQSLMQNIGTVLGYLLAGLATLAASKAKDWYDARRSRSSCREAIKVSVVTQSFLAELRAHWDCDRLTVSQFHNGDHFASGASVQRVSLTHYAVKPGVSAPLDTSGYELRATPATFMTWILNELFEKGVFVCQDFEVPDAWVSRYQTVNGLHTVVLCLIPGMGHKEACGILAFCWLEPRPVSEAEIKELMACSKQVAAYL